MLHRSLLHPHLAVFALAHPVATVRDRLLRQPRSSSDLRMERSITSASSRLSALRRERGLLTSALSPRALDFRGLLLSYRCDRAARLRGWKCLFRRAYGAGHW